MRLNLSLSSTTTQALDLDWVAAQPRIQETIQGHQLFSALRIKICLAILDDAPPGYPTWGHVSRGEESTIVVFWKVDDAKPRTEDLAAEKTEEKTPRRFLLRYYRVFNEEQCELPQAVLDKLPKMETREHSPISACAEIVGCMPNVPEIQHAGSKAFYSVATDRVSLRSAELFTSAEEYYATGFH
jgi:hypothetical protein